MNEADNLYDAAAGQAISFWRRGDSLRNAVLEAEKIFMVDAEEIWNRASREVGVSGPWKKTEKKG